ncbi:LysE family transporter [Octadecabacter sp.]|nr:LysE family transporter [Octadecabacter sp.]
MDWTHLVAFNLTLLAALVSPGPAMLIALRTTLTAGRTHGILTGLGLAVMASIWTAMALLGLNAIFTLFPWAYVAAKTMGAAYLIWLAVKMWRAAHTPFADVARPGAPGRAVMTGFAANLANPKSMLFAASVLVVIFPHDITLGAKTIIVANQLVVEFIAYTGFAILVSTPPARTGYLRMKPLLDRLASVVLGALGLRLILTKS